MIEMKYFKGGLKLRDPQKSYWGSIMDMIENADKIDCLSYSSLYGYIFTVRVPKNKHEFYGLETDSTIEKPMNSLEKKEGNNLLLLDTIKGSIDSVVELQEEFEKRIKSTSNNVSSNNKIYEHIKYTKPITTILLKLSLLSKNPKEYNSMGTNTKMMTKMSDSTEEKDDFELETDMQLQIYKKSLETNNKPICPSIFASEKLDGIASKNFLEKLNNKIQKIIPHRIIKEINSNIHEDVKLGVIAMEYADDFRLYEDIENQTPELYSYIFTNMIRLLIGSRIVHCDLHMNNMLVKTSKNEKKIYDAYLIDFGRCLHVSEEESYGEILGNYVSLVKRVLGDSFSKLGDEREFLKKYLFEDAINTEKSKDSIYKKVMKLILLIAEGDRCFNKVRTGSYEFQSMVLLEDFGIKIREDKNNEEYIVNIENFLNDEPVDIFYNTKATHLIAKKLAEIIGIKVTKKELIFPDEDVNRIGDDTNYSKVSELFTFVKRKGGKSTNVTQKRSSKNGKTRKNK
jgi:tRNA A-37 threonylcarbamoyl transferase component Bud32